MIFWMEMGVTQNSSCIEYCRICCGRSCNFNRIIGGKFHLNIEHYLHEIWRTLCFLYSWPHKSDCRYHCKFLLACLIPYRSIQPSCRWGLFSADNGHDDRTLTQSVQEIDELHMAFSWCPNLFVWYRLHESRSILALLLLGPVSQFDHGVYWYAYVICHVARTRTASQCSTTLLRCFLIAMPVKSLQRYLKAPE